MADCEDDGLEIVSLVIDVQATSKKAISKTRTPVGAGCLITDQTYVRDISDATSCNSRRSQSASTVSTIGVTTQKCPELTPASPPGAYDGREKWAEVDVIGGSKGADSFTTPS